MAHAGYSNENDIYDLALAQPWEDWFGIQHTIRIDVTAIKSPLKSLEFTTLKIKDAICDRFRDICSQRPSVDTKTPDMRIVGFLDAHNFTLYLDTSGEALFKRGWRLETGDAPLRENLAAGLLRVAGWKPGTILLDPMCGSGTILIEAAQMLAGIPPGARREFAFEKFLGFDADQWRAIKDERQAESAAGCTDHFRQRHFRRHGDHHAQQLEQGRHPVRSAAETDRGAGNQAAQRCSLA